MRNKKADLLNNVLTTIIAVVGLAIIFFAAWKLYSVYINQDETNAKNTINTIEGKINLLEDGQFGKIVVKQIPGWFIIGWGKNAPADTKPDICYFKSCLCICKSPGSTLSPDHAKDCTTKGFCRLFEEDVAAAYSYTNYEIDPFTSSQEDIIKFIKNPANYEKEFRDKTTVIVDGQRFEKYSGWTYYYSLISFPPTGASNLIELNIYKDKENVAILEIGSVKGPRTSGLEGFEGVTSSV